MNVLIHAELTPESEAEFEALVAPQGELMREVVLEVIPMIHERIHVKGLAADGSLIGTYTDEYMKVRTGAFGNAKVAKKGKNAGKPTNAGTVSRGPNKGAARPRYNRSADPKVIISLTRQLENDYAVMPGDVGWGVGFTNSHNFDKANWNNKRYAGKVIYDLTDDEERRVVEVTEELLTEKSRDLS
jgi:hypothetical protein